MRREQQISAAVKLLDCRGRELVELAIEAVEYENNRHTLGKKQQTKPFLSQLKSALRRARAARNELPWDIQTFEFVELDKYEKRCAQLLGAVPTAKPKRDELKKRLAAREAQHLLRRHGYKPVTTRGKQWCKLAAVLHGNPKANLYKYCCELQKAGKARLKPGQR